MKIVALDLGKSKSVACVYVSETEVAFETIVSTPALLRDLITRHAPQRVVIEIGAQAGWVCDTCRELKVEVHVANPNHDAWRWKNVKRKTDRDDALRLARLSITGQVPLVHVPGPRMRAWRELIGYRQTLVRRRTQIKNTIRALLTRQAIAWASQQRGWTAKALAELEALSRGGEEVWRMTLREELIHVRHVQESLARIEKQLDTLSAQDARVALLQTIPGVGPRLAETVVAVIDDPHRFQNGKQVGCYAGLTPRLYQSGNTSRSGRISGEGNALLRALLVEVSWVGKRYNPWMQEIYERVQLGSKARKKIAIVAVARRLLVVCWAMLRDGKAWRVAEPKAA